MQQKATALFKTLFVIIVSIIVIGALIEAVFRIPDAAEKIFLGIGGLGVIVMIYRGFISRTLLGR